MDELRLPISVPKLLAIALGLVILLFVLGSFSWPIAILVVCFSALAVPYMIAVIKGEHG